MSDRCILCGAGDESIDHPDYVDWVSMSYPLSTGQQFSQTP